MIWKFGESGSNCTLCGKALEGILCGSYGTIRVCGECFIEIGPDMPISWTLSTEFAELGISEERANEFAATLLAELADYRMVIGKDAAICPTCFGSGQVCSVKCDRCNGCGTIECKACGNRGVDSHGVKCPICRK